MAVEYQLCRPKRILNRHKRPDHWFWTRYTTHPYVGCQHGCEYCYWRESKYCPYPDPEDFSRLIKVKINPPGSYGPPRSYWNRLGQKVAELCQKHGLSDRMPRPIIRAEKLAANKRIAEYLANKAYRPELAGDRGYRIWAYRKAAWALGDLEQDVRVVYERMGVKGLGSIPNLGKKLAREVEQQILGVV